MRRSRYTYHVALGLVLLLSLVLAAGVLAACGSSSGGSSGGGDTVTIGIDASMSGPLAGFGAYEKWAIEKAVAEANAAGGIDVGGTKMQVKTVLLDDKSDPNVASSNVDTLINKNGAIAIIGPIVPTVGNAAALSAEKNGIPYLETGNPVEPFVGVKADAGGWKYAFDFFVLAPPVTDNAYKFPGDLGLKTNMKTFISVDNSPDGPVFGAAAKKSAAANGWTVAGYETHPSTQTEFNSLISKMKASGADYLYILGDTPTFVALRKQMDAAGYEPKILYFQRGAQLQEFADAAGALADGVTLEAYWLPTMPYPGAADLGAAYEQDTGKKAGQIMGPEYAAAQIMMQAISKAGGTDPQKIVDALAATDATFVCGPVKFDANHTSALNLVVAQWQNGTSTQIWPAGQGAAKAIFPMPGAK
jgi:branched-chain amino acid transport system substrate-binding protein